MFSYRKLHLSIGQIRKRVLHLVIFSIELVSDDPENKVLIRHIMKVTNRKEVVRLSQKA